MQLLQGHLYRLFFDWPLPEIHSESIWRCMHSHIPLNVPLKRFQAKVQTTYIFLLRIASEADGPFDRYEIKPEYNETLQRPFDPVIPYPAWTGNVIRHDNLYPHLVTEIQPDQLLAYNHLPHKTHRWDEFFRR